MSLQAFATTEQMNRRSRGAITLSSHPFLADELASATQVIRDVCRWHVAGLEELHYRKTWPTSELVYLPAMQIESITAVSVADVAFDADLMDLVEFDADSGWTNIYGRKVDVTYTAGYAQVPESLVTLTLQIAARALGSPLGAVREQTLASSVQWSATAPGVAGGAAVLEHEMRTLSPYILGRLP